MIAPVVSISFWVLFLYASYASSPAYVLINVSIESLNTFLSNTYIFILLGSWSFSSSVSFSSPFSSYVSSLFIYDDVIVYWYPFIVNGLWCCIFAYISCTVLILLLNITSAFTSNPFGAYIVSTLYSFLYASFCLSIYFSNSSFDFIVPIKSPSRYTL